MKNRQKVKGWCPHCRMTVTMTFHKFVLREGCGEFNCEICRRDFPSADPYAKPIVKVMEASA